MKKNLFTLLCLAAFSFIQAQNVPNGGFENWTSGNPDNWTTNNFSPYIPVTQVTPGHSGTYAAKGEVVSTSSGVLAPVLESTDAAGNGFAVTQAYTTLNFWYKASLTSANTLLVLISMKDAGDNLVATGSMNFAGTVSTFTPATVPITYFAPDPVECTIQFMILDTTAQPATVGNYFILDDVSLSGLATSVQENAAINIPNIYLNPAQNEFTISTNILFNGAQLEIYDSFGRLIYRQGNITTLSNKISAEQFPPGIYFIRIFNTQKSVLQKLVIE